MTSRMTISGECEIEIWQMEMEMGQKRYIAKVSESEDDGTLAYRKALADLLNFERKIEKREIA